MTEAERLAQLIAQVAENLRTDLAGLAVNAIVIEMAKYVEGALEELLVADYTFGSSRESREKVAGLVGEMRFSEKLKLFQRMAASPEYEPLHSLLNELRLLRNRIAHDIEEGGEAAPSVGGSSVYSAQGLFEFLSTANRILSELAALTAQRRQRDNDRTAAIRERLGEIRAALDYWNRARSTPLIN